MSYMKAAMACIDLSALQHNLQRVKEQAPDSKVMVRGEGEWLRSWSSSCS